MSKTTTYFGGIFMKRMLMLLIISLAATTIFAQSFTVQEVTGRVERDTGNGNWTAVTRGETLRADSVIRTVIGSSLTVRNGDQVLTVPAMKNGRLSDIAGIGAAITIQGRVSETDTSAVRDNAARVTTASARASDAAGEAEIEE
jgi:hypothetical protein